MLKDKQMKVINVCMIFPHQVKTDMSHLLVVLGSSQKW